MVVPHSGVLAPTLDTLAELGPLPTQPTVHLDRGYDSAATRTTLAKRGLAGRIAEKHKPARCRRAGGGRWNAPTRGATRSASCAGAPSDAVMRDWARQHRYGNATTRQFIALAERDSGRNLRHFFDVWLFQPRKPTSW